MSDTKIGTKFYLYISNLPKKTGLLTLPKKMNTIKLAYIDNVHIHILNRFIKIKTNLREIKLKFKNKPPHIGGFFFYINKQQCFKMNLNRINLLGVNI